MRVGKKKMPKSQQPKAKRALQEIWMAETKAAAELAFGAFVESYTPKYKKAADCLGKDRDTLRRSTTSRRALEAPADDQSH